MLRFNKYLKHTSQTFLLFTLFTISACNDSESVNSVNKTEVKNNKPIQSIQLQLSKTSLNKDEFLGLIVPKIKQASPCPYLSDDTLKKVVKNSSTLKLRESSDKQCYWSKNLGFSVKLTIEPLTSAKPPAERAYNLDVPPVIKPQAGPGKNAVVLYDTAWEKELAYAFAFEQDNKLITIFVTGLTTDSKKLTIAAEEVASKLLTAIQLDAPTEKFIGFDMCSIWSKAEIQSIIGTPLNVIKGNLDCKWETGANDNLKQINIRISSGKYVDWDYIAEIGGVKVPNIGEGAMLYKVRKNKNIPEHVVSTALYKEKLVNILVANAIPNHKEIAVSLSKNIDERLK